MSNLTSLFTDIANTIRTKKGTTAEIVAENFPQEIASITTVNNQDKTIKENGVYTADTGYTGLGTVTIEVPTGGAGDGVKIASNYEELSAMSGTEGEIALVYGETLGDLVAGQTYTEIYCPRTIVLDTTITGTKNIFLAQGTSVMTCNTWVSLRPNTIKFYKKASFSGTALNVVTYSSSDGITYTRDDGEDGVVSIFDIYEGAYSSIEVQTANLDLLTQMFKGAQTIFTGVYTYNSSEGMWQIAPSQLDTNSDNVYNTTYYGATGLGTGTLQDTLNLTADGLRFRADIYTNFANLNLASSVTSLSYTFDNYTGTTLPMFDMSNITSLLYTFRNCPNLKTVPNLNTDNCVNMNYAFQNCPNLEELPTINASNFTTFQYVFQKCTKLKNVDIINTENITDYSFAFSQCSSLEQVPNINTSNCVNLTATFQACTQLVDMPVLDTSKVTTMSYFVYNCPNLSTEALTNILAMCVAAKDTYAATKTLADVGLSETQANICTGLSDWSTLSAAGWTTGY